MGREIVEMALKTAVDEDILREISCKASKTRGSVEGSLFPLVSMESVTSPSHLSDSDYREEEGGSDSDYCKAVEKSMPGDAEDLTMAAEARNLSVDSALETEAVSDTYKGNENGVICDGIQKGKRYQFSDEIWS